MKKFMILFAILLFAGGAPAFAAGSHDHESATDHSGHVGDMIHESDIEGYRFTYHLIDNRKPSEEMKDMKGSQEADTTHHLMVYVMDPAGHAVEALQQGPQWLDHDLLLTDEKVDDQSDLYPADIDHHDMAVRAFRIGHLACGLGHQPVTQIEQRQRTVPDANRQLTIDRVGSVQVEVEDLVHGQRARKRPRHARRRSW